LLLRVLLLLFMKPFAARHACTGVIVNADQPADKRPKLQGAAFKGTPTRILLLRNMVGPGEVDEDLEEEVRHLFTVALVVVYYCVCRCSNSLWPAFGGFSSLCLSFAGIGTGNAYFVQKLCCQRPDGRFSRTQAGCFVCA
jgi:hypothetical protein